MPTPVEYAGTTTTRPAMVLYPIALACGIGPMALGLSMLAAYWLTERSALIFIGLFTLAAGLVAVLIGTVCLIRYLSVTRGAATVPYDVRRRHAWVAGSALAANLPAATVCVLCGVHLVFRVMVPVSVQNLSGRRLDNIVLVTPGGPINVGPLAPFDTMSRRFDASHGGAFSVQAVRGSKTLSAAVRRWPDGDAARRDKVRIVIDDAMIIAN